MKRLLFCYAGLAVLLLLAGCGSSSQLNSSKRLAFQEEIGRAPNPEMLRQTIGNTLNFQGYEFDMVGSDLFQTEWQVWENVKWGVQPQTIQVRERFTVRIADRGETLAVARVKHECQQLSSEGEWLDVEIPQSLKDNYRAIKEIVHASLMPYMHQASY